MRAFVFPAFVLLCFAAVGSHGWFFGSKREPDHGKNHNNSFPEVKALLWSFFAGYFLAIVLIDAKKKKGRLTYSLMRKNRMCSALMVDGFEAVDLELPLSDWKAMEVFVRSKEIVEREGLMPCVELVQ
eukprot:748189-Amorphochlora_amoeboformis.AAC.1